METHKPVVRFAVPATAALGTLAVLGLGGYLLSRRTARPGRAAPRRATVSADALVQESMNLLAATRGYCELAKIKGENGTALSCRMDASIETIDEISLLLRHLLAVCRKRAL